MCADQYWPTTNIGDKVIYTQNMISVLEEADNLIVCHINDLIGNGFSKILVMTCDSDVVVILLGFMKVFLDVMKDLLLLVEFKTANNKRIISINSSYLKLGDEICSHSKNH